MCECADVSLTNIPKRSDSCKEMMTQHKETRTDETAAREEAKRVYIQHQGKIESVTRRNLRNALSDTNKCMVHDGKVLNSERISQLKDNTVVHFVNKLSGGGKRKDRKKANQTNRVQQTRALLRLTPRSL